MVRSEVRPAMKIRHFLIAASWSMICIMSSFAAEEPGWREQLQLQESRLAELESLHGPYNPSLIEPLQSMTRLLQEQSSTSRVAELQDRQLLIMRIAEGLENPRQIPLLIEMVLTRIALGNSEEVVNLLQNLRHVQSTQGDPEAILLAMENQAFWYLTGASRGDSQQRVSSFFNATKVIGEMEETARELYGEDDPALAPWLYKSAVNDYKLIRMANAGGRIEPMVKFELSARGEYTSHRFSPGVSGGNSYSGRNFMRESRSKVKDVEKILVLADDIEAQAMAVIYGADFQLLLGRSTGFAAYRKAQELLLQAGVDQERIDLFFSRPQALPVDHFYSTLEEAILHQEEGLAAWQPPDEAIVHLAPFVAWDEEVSRIMEPVSEHAFWESTQEYDQVDLRLSISNVGRASVVNILSAEPDVRRNRTMARKALRATIYRPAIVGGRGQRVRDIYMRYLLPREEN